MRKLGDNSTFIDGISDSVGALIDVVDRQFKTESRGFFCLGVGLIMQLIGGFEGL